MCHWAVSPAFSKSAFLSRLGSQCIKEKNKKLHSWGRALQVRVNKCPTRCNYTKFILSVNCSTCFRWHLHPSTGAQITVSTASGISQPLMLTVMNVEEMELVSVPTYDGWRSHPKHVEQFTDKINCV